MLFTIVWGPLLNTTNSFGLGLAEVCGDLSRLSTNPSALQPRRWFATWIWKTY